MIVRTQGTDEPIDASPTRISRMLVAVFDNELVVKAWESPTWRSSWETDPQESLNKARRRRDEHLAELNHVIDYALTSVAYEDVRCGTCKLPAEPLDFIRAVPDFEEPAMACQTCLGRGLVRAKRTDAASKAACKRVTYFKKVLPDVICSSKIRAGTSDQNAAYMELEARNRILLVKFGSEKQTALEGDDALQGVRQGIIDAAMRFDPARKEGAMFSTVAYSWCYRNSRARHFSQKRAGVYAPSIDSMSTEDGTGLTSFVTSADGALGKIKSEPGTIYDGSRCGSTCRICGDVAFLHPETWESTGLCQAHQGVEEGKKNPGPGSDYEPRGRVRSCPEGLQLDLASQLKRLSPEGRDVVMCFYDEMTDTQTARKLGKNREQVRALRTAAFELMQAGLTPYYVEMLRE